VGVVIEREGERAAYLATEVFVRLATPIDVDDAPDELIERLNTARAKRKSRPLKVDAALSELCAAGAADFFASAGATQKAIVEGLSSKAGSRARGYTRLSSVMVLVDSLDEAAGLDALLDPAARAVGIGVAQGSRADTVENAIALVAILAY
jgi:hypothetical protein